jgi:hypothetical protein
METLGNNLVAKSGKKVAHNYYCEKCDYTCSKVYNWKKHIETAKHSQETNGHILETQSGKKWQKNGTMCCEKCNKEFKTRSGLWKHSKTCNFKDKTEEKETITTSSEVNELKEIMKYLMKENSEMKNMMMSQNISTQNIMMDVIKTGTHNTTHTNSHNKTFNLNFFLNETCKDAMNIMDFVDSLKIQLSDLETVGKLGYVEGISKIIVRNLNSLDETKRPVHCTDTKREVMYVKDEDKWEKENENKQKMRKVIKHVTHKNSKLIKEFKAKYQGCEKSSSKYSDQYDKLIIEAMGGKGDNDLEKEDKIIRNIAKTVTIDKM